MTPEQEERTRRFCEALGTMACIVAAGLLNSLLELFGIHTERSQAMRMIFVATGYLGAFLALDRWWSKSPLKFQGDGRPNWFFLPFVGSFFAFLNIFLYDWAGPPCPPVFASFSEVILASMLWGLAMLPVMFFFWFCGLLHRIEHRAAAARTTQCP